jgi:hypothetical protein
MNIKFISSCVDGDIPLDELEIVCVPKNKYSSVNLCIKANMNIPFAQIMLFDTDSMVDAKESFEAATALGNEIARAFNERLSRSPDKLRRGQEDAKISEEKSSKMNESLSNGRHYLMGVRSEDLTVEDALEAFGFGRNGLG